MPELSRFHNIIIAMFYKDNKQHNLPHFHAYYAEYEIIMDLDGNIIIGHFPPKQLKLVTRWMRLHHDELQSAWQNAVRSKPFSKIKPLD